MDTKFVPPIRFVSLIPISLSIIGLYCISLTNYLLFHSLSELFSVVVAFGIFIVSWNSRKFSDNNYLLFLGVIYFFIGGIDLFHALSYKGMGVFDGYGANLPTQLWIAARYMESISLLIAPILFLSSRKFNFPGVFTIYLIITLLLFVSIFTWKIFPDCFIEGVGLTSFKKFSEYIISCIIAGSVFVLFAKKNKLDSYVFKLIIAATVFTICSELAFTFYVSVYGLSNLAGHFFKIISFVLIYKAIVEASFKRPYEILFGNLKNKEESLRLSLGAAKAGTWTWDITNDDVIWDDRMQKIFGLEPGTFDGTFDAWRKRVHPDDINEAEKATLDALKQGIRYGHEYRAKSKTGGWSVVEAHAAILKDSYGKPVRMSGFALDITDRRMMEIQLRESEELHRLTLSNISDAVFITDIEGNFTYVGPNVAVIFGYLQNEVKALKNIDTLLGRNHFNLIELENSRELTNIEYNIQDKFGTYHTLLVNIKLVEVNEGCILYTCRDISDIKLTERALKESEQKFKLLFENAPLSYQSLDESGNLIEVNQTWLNTLGYKRDEVLGENFSDFLVPEWKEHFIENFPRFKAVGEILGVEFEMIKKDGNKIFASFHGKISKTPNGTFKQTHCFFNDITNQRRIEKEQALMMQKLTQIQKIESIGNLAGGIAHDFNNILFPIIGMSEMLMEDFPSDSQEYEDAKEILQAGKRGSELVMQILSFSRQHEHKLMPVRVQKIMKEVLKLTRATIPSSIEIQINIQQDCGMVLADSTQLHQVYMNLITNAYQAIEDASGKINFELKEVILNKREPLQTSLPPGKYVQLLISDNGIGMAPAILDKVFEPYFTTKARGKGTGLGLAVVYGIIKEHKGDILVTSHEGKGTSFKIYLPLIQKEESMINLSVHDIELKNGNERILILDDEKSIVNIISKVLTRLGYKVTGYTDSQEALIKFKSDSDNFDLIISDMTMPKMTGDEFASEVLSIRPEIPIIICTGFSERLNKEQAQSIGVRGFLMKPVVKHEMAHLVKKLLDEKGES